VFPTTAIQSSATAERTRQSMAKTAVRRKVIFIGKYAYNFFIVSPDAISEKKRIRGLVIRIKG